MNKKRKLRDVVIPLCEGEAEINLFSSLKAQHSNKVVDFRKPIDLGGFTDLASFKKKYNKRIKEQNLKPKKDFASVSFLFLIDGDLDESQAIKAFIESEGHLVQLCEPNTEGMILKIVNKPQTQTVQNKDYRKKCKTEFSKHFGCEAHKIKEAVLNGIFTATLFKKYMPVLHDLFNK